MLRPVSDVHLKTNIALKPIEKKWIDELESMGYTVQNKLVYEVKEP